MYKKNNMRLKTQRFTSRKGVAMTWTAITFNKNSLVEVGYLSSLFFNEYVVLIRDLIYTATLEIVHFHH